MKTSIKFKVRISSLIMCIILLSNFFMSLSHAVQYVELCKDGKGWSSLWGWGLIDYRELKVEELPSGGFDVQNLDNVNPNDLWIRFYPKQTGAYQISVYYEDYLNSNVRYYQRYRISRSNTPGTNQEVNYENTLALAVNRPEDDAYSGLPVPELIRNSGDTTVNVILEEGYTYGIKFVDSKSLANKRHIKVSITTGTSLAETYYTNMPSSYVTTLQGNISDNAQATPAGSSIKTVPIAPDLQKAYLRNCGLKEVSNEVESPLMIESMLVGLIIFVGEILLFFAESFLNIENLTMDKLIFNKLGGNADPKIDLRGVFPRFFDTKTDPVTGILGQEGIITAVRNVYEGLRYVAIIVYILSFLYLGLKTLMAVGTPKESTTKKYIEYWITGAFILLFVPYFLPFIPHISNKLTESLSSHSEAAGEFSVRYIASYLGERFLGEDADVREMKKEIDRRMGNLETLMNEMKDKDPNWKPRSQEEIDEEFDKYIATKISQDAEDPDGLKETLKNMYRSAMNYITNHREGWNSSNDRELEARIDEMVNTMYKGSGIQSAKKRFKRLLTDTYYENGEMRPSPFIRENFMNESNYNLFMENLNLCMDEIIQGKGSTNYQSSETYYKILFCIFGGTGLDRNFLNQRLNSFGNVCRTYGGIANIWKNTLNKYFDEYKKDAVAYELDTLTKMQKSLVEDPMVTLVQLAKSEQRVVYAIAWIILLYEMFALLFMYYKRLFVIIILVCIFPLVAAVYVIDKMGDGHAQSLQNWFKEFFANCVVQFFHATIYVLIVNIGIDICRENPSRNWFFLVICILFLFPAEKLLRGMVGLQSSTLGGLKLNLVGGIAATIGLSKGMAHLGKGVASGAGKGFGALKGLNDAAAAQGLHGKAKLAFAAHAVKDSFNEKYDKMEEEARKKRAEKAKKRREQHDSRNYRAGLRDEMAEKAKQIDKSSRTAKDKMYLARARAKDAVSSVRDTASNIANKTGVARAAQAVGNAANKVGTGVKNAAGKVAGTKVGQKALNVAKGVGKVGKYAGKKLYQNKGKIAKAYGKAIKGTVAAVSAVDALNEQGIGTAAGVFTQVAGFKGSSKGNTSTTQPTGGNQSSNYNPANNYSSSNPASSGGSAPDTYTPRYTSAVRSALNRSNSGPETSYSGSSYGNSSSSGGYSGSNSNGRSSSSQRSSYSASSSSGTSASSAPVYIDNINISTSGTRSRRSSTNKPRSSKK